MGANDLVRWPRLTKPAGWAFKQEHSRAHFVVCGMGNYKAVCGNFTLFKPYEADSEMVKCSNCLRIIKNRPEYRRVFEPETWACVEASTRKHFFRFEHGIWRSACGVVRTLDQFVDGTGVELCRKCVSYLGENDAKI